MNKYLKRFLDRILPSTKYEIWKEINTNSYIMVKNIDGDNYHYEYYPFIINDILYRWETPFWVKTKILHTFRFIPHGLLIEGYVKIMDYNER